MKLGYSSKKTKAIMKSAGFTYESLHKELMVYNIAYALGSIKLFFINTDNFREPSLEALHAMAKIFKVSIEAFLENGNDSKIEKSTNITISVAEYTRLKISEADMISIKKILKKY